MNIAPIHVFVRPELTAYRGKLLSGQQRGKAVHAGSQIRKHEIVLDSSLLENRAEFERILLHEVHHFIWSHLGPKARASYEELLHAERSRGELGWSAESLKLALSAEDRLVRGRRWKNYACESFCDTGAWFYMSRRVHPEWTLAPRFREHRGRWFQECFGSARA